MKKDSFRIYKEIFKNNNGILRRFQAIRLGIPEHIIYEMTKNGDLIKDARGLFRLADFEPLSNPDLVQIGLLIPKGVVFLISALYFHRLTTQIPRQVYVALPRGADSPKIEYPPLKVFFRSLAQFQSGIVEHTIDGIKVRIYNKEKTIADCFKYHRYIGKEVALEALKDYMAESSPNTRLLMEYARINRVEKIIQPYLEALL